MELNDQYKDLLKAWAERCGKGIAICAADIWLIDMGENDKEAAVKMRPLVEDYLNNLPDYPPQINPRAFGPQGNDLGLIFPQHQSEADKIQEQAERIGDLEQELRIVKRQLEQFLPDYPHQINPRAFGPQGNDLGLIFPQHQSEADKIQEQAERIGDLEQELRIVKRQLEQFQSRQMDEIFRRRQEAMDFYKREYERTGKNSKLKGIHNEGNGLDEIDYT